MATTRWCLTSGTGRYVKKHRQLSHRAVQIIYLASTGKRCLQALRFGNKGSTCARGIDEETNSLLPTCSDHKKKVIKETYRDFWVLFTCQKTQFPPRNPAAATRTKRVGPNPVTLFMIRCTWYMKSLDATCYALMQVKYFSSSWVYTEQPSPHKEYGG